MIRLEREAVPSPSRDLRGLKALQCYVVTLAAQRVEPRSADQPAGGPASRIRDVCTYIISFNSQASAMRSVS